jgi:hypothetical protein
VKSREKSSIAIDNTDIQKITGEYLGSLYSNKFFKIEESDDFLDIAFYQN